MLRRMRSQDLRWQAMRAEHNHHHPPRMNALARERNTKRYRGWFGLNLPMWVIYKSDCRVTDFQLEFMYMLTDLLPLVCLVTNA